MLMAGTMDDAGMKLKAATQTALRLQDLAVLVPRHDCEARERLAASLDRRPRHQESGVPQRRTRNCPPECVWWTPQMPPKIVRPAAAQHQSEVMTSL